MICLPITDYALNAPIDPGCNSRILIQYPYGDCFPATQVCDLTEGSLTKDKCIVDPNGCFFVDKSWSDCLPYCNDLGYQVSNGCINVCLSPAGDTCACRIPI